MIIAPSKLVYLPLIAWCFLSPAVGGGPVLQAAQGRFGVLCLAAFLSGRGVGLTISKLRRAALRLPRVWLKRNTTATMSTMLLKSIPLIPSVTLCLISSPPGGKHSSCAFAPVVGEGPAIMCAPWGGDPQLLQHRPGSGARLELGDRFYGLLALAWLCPGRFSASAVVRAGGCCRACMLRPFAVVGCTSGLPPITPSSMASRAVISFRCCPAALGAASASPSRQTAATASCMPRSQGLSALLNAFLAVVAANRKGFLSMQDYKASAAHHPQPRAGFENCPAVAEKLRPQASKTSSWWTTAAAPNTPLFLQTLPAVTAAWCCAMRSTWAGARAQNRLQLLPQHLAKRSGLRHRRLGRPAHPAILRVMEALCQHPDSPCPGRAIFSGKDVPACSSFGNGSPRRVFRFLVGLTISDTQTGLRAVPTAICALLQSKGERLS